MKSILKICKIHTKYPNFWFSKKFEDLGTLGLHDPRVTNQGVAAHFSWHSTMSPQCPPLCHFPQLQVRVNAVSSHSPLLHSFNCVGPIRTGAEKLRARLYWVGKLGKDFFFFKPWSSMKPLKGLLQSNNMITSTRFNGQSGSFKFQVQELLNEDKSRYLSFPCSFTENFITFL